jgi:hypothetical protein
MVSSPAARVRRATPARSRLGRVGDRDSGTLRKPNRNVRAATGTLTRKIGRQLRPKTLADRRIPPSACPLTCPAAMVIP